jgi:dTDP-glucose pyrophosphorylase
MKAVILAAGRGSRLAALSQEQNKCMVVVHGKPLIEYSLACAAALDDVQQIIIVIGYKGDEIQARYGNRFGGKELIFVQQPRQRGLVHAIECAQTAIGTSNFMLMLGDELMIAPKHGSFMAEFIKSGAFVLCGVVNVENTELIRKTYAVIQGPDGRVYRLIEKPGYIFNNMMGTGNCVFRNAILDYIAKTPINQNRGEKELTDLIQCAADAGHVIKTFPICSSYVNVNSADELEQTKSYFAHF